MRKKKAIERHYAPRITPGRENYDVLDWASAASQEARFRVLVENVPLAGKSLLDVGAGLGDLWGFLKRRGLAVDYTGVDLLETMVQAARHRHPDARFLCADLFADSPFDPDSFDIVFCSGMFNLDVGNNLAFMPVALASFFRLARDYVVVNMLHKRARGGEGAYFYYDPTEIIEMLQPYRCEVRLLDDYLPNDFTVVCRKTPVPEGRH